MTLYINKQTILNYKLLKQTVSYKTKIKKFKKMKY